jgi:glycoside hydrolase family 16
MVLIYLFEPTKLDLEKVDKINAEEVYLIVNKQSGKLIDVQGASKDNSANIWQYKYINGDGQKWRAKFVDNKYWEFENVNSGKVIDVEGFGTTDGINISQFTNSHTMNQQWELRPFEESFMIINRNSGKVVDVVNHSYIDGANITQFTGFPTNNQLWIFYKQKSK